MFLLVLGVVAYVTYTLNLWGPMLAMADAASRQALEEFKKRLREFLESTETGQKAMAVAGEDIKLHTLDGRGRKAAVEDVEEDEI